MGTLSKRPLRAFGFDVKERVEDFRSHARSKLDDLQSRVHADPTHEGALTKGIERLTAALPSSTWLALAGVSLVGSVALEARGRRHLGLLVGQLVPTLLILGLYNKIVKVAGSERSSSARSGS